MQLSTSANFTFNREALERPDLGPPARTINMIRLGEALMESDAGVGGPPVRALVVYNSNPAAVAPDRNVVLRGLAREDLFTVVLEHFQTDTADWADIVLPATTQLEHWDLHLAYGLVLVFFGIMVRVLLWPLNQKAMRANMQLQAVQPLMKDLQERHKNDPQKLQQEMFKLYKEYNVNPLGGCWPMLLPMPVLFALFFVFQNTIELRGQSFLWLPDLARPDPLYIIPVVMGLSMYGLSKVGQIGMEPNPQMKMMLYIMPVMMTFLFLNFASGLNLYYAVSNIASIPQQWILMRERLKKNAAPVVATKPVVAGTGKTKKKA